MEQDQHEEPPVDAPRTLRREQEKHIHREHQQDIQHTPYGRLLHDDGEHDIGQ